MSSKNVIDLRKGVQKPVAPQQDLRLTPEREAPRLHSQGRRISPVRVRRRRTRYIIALVILVIIGAITYGVSWVSYLPQYSVGTVTVIGTSQVPAIEVHDYVESLLHTGAHPFLSKDNIFLYNPGSIQREVVGYFPRIASATVSRASLLATDVTVSVTERQPFALWCADQAQTDCYEMDDTGYVFAQAPGAQGVAPDTVSGATSTASTASSSLGQASPSQAATTSPIAVPQQSSQYVFFGGLGTSSDATSTASISSPQAATSTATSGPSALSPIGQTFVGAHMPGIVGLLKLLGQAGFTPMGAAVQNAQDFWVPLGQGFYIKASYGEDPQTIVSNLQLVLGSDALVGKESELEYVDLRFGDRVYYKLQGQDETQTKS